MLLPRTAETRLVFRWVLVGSLNLVREVRPIFVPTSVVAPRREAGCTLRCVTWLVLVLVSLGFMYEVPVRKSSGPTARPPCDESQDLDLCERH